MEDNGRINRVRLEKLEEEMKLLRKEVKAHHVAHHKTSEEVVKLKAEMRIFGILILAFLTGLIGAFLAG